MTRRMFQSTRPRGTRPSADADAAGFDVSIHASARDATRHMTTRRRAGGFNPRVRAGRDRGLSATSTACSCFNPRVRAGRDDPNAGAVGRIFLFQSTRPRGTRQAKPAAGFSAACFSPRVRAGRDYSPASLQADLLFQSTRPRGTRPHDDVVSRSLFQFQSTRPRGTRPPAVAFSTCCFLFQSTRPRGTRRNPDGRQSADNVSIHASARDAT